MASDCIDHGLHSCKGGYVQVPYEGKRRYAHRVAFAKAHNLSMDEVPTLLRHTCDNPRCINPEHLIPGTHQDNANDRVARGRSAKEQPLRRVLTDEQADAVATRYINRATRNCKVDGVCALAKEYNVSTQAIYGAIKRASGVNPRYRTDRHTS